MTSVMSRLTTATVWVLICFLDRSVDALVDSGGGGGGNNEDDRHCVQLPFPECKCDETSVHCTDAGFNQSDALLHVSHYPDVVSVTFCNDHFVQLPTHVLGPGPYMRLETLNLTSNRFRRTDPDALRGMPNLIALDLSDNRLQFTDRHANFFRPTPDLRRLFLRNALAFADRSIDADDDRRSEEGLFFDALEQGRLQFLQLLDLSDNRLSTFPSSTLCALPKLEILLLPNNRLQTFSAVVVSVDRQQSTGCLKKLRLLDLSRNAISTVDSMLAAFLVSAPRNSVRLRDSPLVCHEWFYDWTRKTPSVRQEPSSICRSDTVRDRLSSGQRSADGQSTVGSDGRRPTADAIALPFVFLLIAIIKNAFLYVSDG